MLEQEVDTTGVMLAALIDVGREATWKKWNRKWNILKGGV